MTPKEIIEGNRIIAEFIGGKKSTVDNDSRLIRFDQPVKSQYAFKPVELQYHSSWDWLMPVVEKIEKLKHDDFGYKVIIYENYCAIGQHRGRIGGTMKWESSKPFKKDMGHGRIHAGTWRPDTKIEAVWLAVIEFIKWHNQQK